MNIETTFAPYLTLEGLLYLYQDFKNQEENMKSKKKQIEKEALLTVGMYLVYFAWWYYFAYCFGEKEVSRYHYILGLPEWFFIPVS